MASGDASPVRVLHVVDTLHAGGAEHLILTTVKHLDRTRFASTVVALGPPRDLQAAFERAGVRVECLDARSPQDWRRSLFGLIHVIRRVRPDIVHSHLRLANVYARVAAKAGGVRGIVTTLHHLDYTFWPARTWKTKLWRLADMLTGRGFGTRFVAVSKAVRDDYRINLGIRDADVIYNYIEPKSFSAPGESLRAAARARLGIASHELILLNVARLAPEKGQRHVIDAMPRIVDRVPGARLLLAGDGPEAPMLRERSAALGVDRHVTLLGKSDDVRTLLAASDLFVFPSTAEAFGIALIEAMAAGLPVVASGVGGILEIVDDGVDGLLVPPGDPAALADAIVRLATDGELRHELGEHARKTVAERFSVEVGIPRLEAVYAKALAKA